MLPNKDHRGASSKAPPTDPIDELTISPARRAELLEQSRAGIVSRMSEMIAAALSRMSEELAELAARRSDRDEQRVLLDAVAVIKLHRIDIEARFRDSFVALFNQRLAGKSVNRFDVEPDAQELALVDDAEMRDKLRVQALIERARSKLDPNEVLGMRARLAALANRDWFDETAHPAAPEAVFEALDPLGSEPLVKSALLDAFAPYIAEQLNTVYSGANEHLRTADVLPRIKARVQINPDTGKPYQDHESEPDDDPDAETFVLPKNGPEREAILEALAREVAAGGQEARASAVQMLTEPENFGVADLPLPEPEAELIEALDTMQTGPLGQAPSLRDLTAHAREKGSPLDQLTVEIVSLIFDFLYQDPRIPPPVKNQLLRLQVVAVKAALLDRSFFASRQHPIRRLIDRATDISCDPETNAAEGSAFTSGLVKLIDAILDEFDRDLAVFEKGLSKLDLLEAAENERRSIQLAELVRSTERDEAEAVAREMVGAELSARCDDETPEFIDAFLQDWWVEVMITARLEDRRNGEEVYWSARLNTAEQLLWTITPKTPEEVTQMAVMLPKLIGGLAAGLKTIDGTEQQHARFFDELMKWHTKIIDRAKHNGAAAAARAIQLGKDGRVTFRQAVSDQSDAAGPAPAPARSAFDSQVDELRRGQRFELRLEGIAPIAVKLAFVSPARKLFALSRFPDFAQSFDREEFVEMLRVGELVLIDQKPTIDRAIAAVGGSSPAQGEQPVTQPDRNDGIKTLCLAEDDASQIPV